MTSAAPGLLSKIGYSSYWQQLLSLDPSPAGMLVCNGSGTLVWSSDELPRDARDSAASVLAELIGQQHAGRARKLRHPINGSYEIQAAPVEGNSGNFIGVVGLVLSRQKGSESPGDKVLDSILSGIAENVAREGDLLSELDAMATELALRYEELNLLYNIADDSEAEQSECAHALSELIRACGPHLDSNIAAIILPQQNVVLYHAPETESPGNVAEALASLERELCPWAIANRRPLVFNQKEETLRATIAPGVDGKLMACPVYNELGAACGIVAVIRPEIEADFTTGDRRLLEVVATKAEKLLQLSYDPLTGLMNRNEFLRNLDKSVSTARSRDLNFCLLVMEIDHLKVINDAFGHEAGDALISYVTGALRMLLEADKNVISRIGGDHFAALLPNCSLQEGQRLARRLAKAIGSAPFCWRESRRNITVSIGLAVMSKETQRAKAILYAAEIACDVARGFSTDRIAVYNEGDPLFLEKREDMRWVGLIQDALLNDRFSIYCQKIASVAESEPGTVFHEVLLRLRDPSGKISTPGHFMPAAERFYLMPEIDRWVVRSLFQFLSEARKEIDLDGHVWAINLSGQTLSDDGFLGFVTDELGTYAIPPKCICFEITETAAVTNIDRAQRLIDSLRAIGCLFSLDDFGTGLSSFGYLKSLRIDHLKIDGCFVQDVLENKTSEAVVSSIIHLGHVLGIEVTAEWVENGDIGRKVRELGVDHLQGFDVDRPQSIEDWLQGFQSDR